MRNPATALVIIDVQRGMFEQPEELHEGEAVVARIAGLIERARATGTPVIFVQHAGGAGHPFAPDAPGFPIHRDLTPLLDEVVVLKRRSSAFHETDFEQQLRAMGIDHLIVAGMQSQMCVDSAIRGAYERDFKITLVKDGHSTFDTPVLGAAQVVAQQNDTLSRFASVVPAAEIDLG